MSGTYTPHVRLEKRIARFKKSRAALLFNSGYSANTGIIPSIAGADTVIFSDELNHASIIDGIRLSRAKVKIFQHKNTAHLESLLKRYSYPQGQKKLVITDTVFSMDGDIAPLREIASLSKKHGALLMIDDAHATGVLGKDGRGGLEHFGLPTDSVLQMGTLSKAAGCLGGFAAGPEEFISVVMNTARSFIFSTSLPPAIAGACITAIDIIATRSKNRRKRLWKNRERLVKGLQSLGYDTLGSETPIVPVFAGEVRTALKLADYLLNMRIFAPAIRPPTVPEGLCRVRFSVTAQHTDEDIDYALETLKKFRSRNKPQMFSP